jgi:hypothetical protein
LNPFYFCKDCFEKTENPIIEYYRDDKENDNETY